ncbi:MAG: alpha/beta hydrolase [Acidimicrobiia bacterium]|nr:alpha/beta hydrolase [Acidimicrobiia bacterium]MYB73999.1 alpha/beta hydrolase [Acidimicrobiia bacterium]MYH98716.1 alpha/beta hydrolase [Acidimicrobiia bacterium]
MVMLDAEIEQLKHTVPTRDLSVELLPEIRATLPVQFPQLSDAVERTDYVVDEANEVVVRVHRPRGIDGVVPCVYSIHGGGYIRGTYDMDDAKFDRWCPTYGIVGVSVEYRLAPETPYPGPLEDCYAGLKWTYDHAEELGIGRGKIGITGVSAGGGLCAALALLARDRDEVPLQFQLLDCPMLDDRQITPSSQLDDLVIWTKQTNAFGWRCYLGDLYGSEDVPYTAAAARAEDLSGLPDAYVCVGGADGFRDEDITYAMRLYGAGVPTELHVYPGGPHGVGLFPQTQIAQRYAADREDWLRRQLARLS